MASASFSSAMTEPPTTLPELPRHPPPTLDRQGRRALLAWLWAAARPGGGGQQSTPLPPSCWHDLATLAEGHGLAALVADSVRAQADPSQADARDGLARLEDAAFRTLARGRRLARDQAALHDALVGAALPFAWLKGSWLVHEGLYPEPFGRPRADLDLYLPEPAWAAAAEVLRGLGYRAAQRSWKHAAWLNAGHRVVDLRGEHEDNPRSVELHGWLGEGFRGLRWDLSADLAPLRPAQRLPSELALAHLAAHSTVAMLERRLRLVQLLDLHLLARSMTQLALERLIEIGLRPGAARFLWPSLALAERLTPTPALEPLLAALAAASGPRLRGWLEAHDIDSLSWPGRREAARPLLEIPALWPRDAAELRTVWRHILLPPPEVLADRYPELAAAGRQRTMFVRHVGFTLHQAGRRWRQRPR